MPTAVMRETGSWMLMYNHFEYYNQIFSLSSVLQFTGTDPNGTVRIKTDKNEPKWTCENTETDFKDYRIGPGGRNTYSVVLGGHNMGLGRVVFI